MNIKLYVCNYLSSSREIFIFRLYSTVSSQRQIQICIYLYISKIVYLLSHMPMRMRNLIKTSVTFSLVATVCALFHDY